jgi:hypothetical protein
LDRPSSYNHEYSGIIYKVPGGWEYLDPQLGQGEDFDLHIKGDRSIIDGIYHTHTGNGAKSDRFSGVNSGVTPGREDTLIGNGFNRDSFIMTRGDVFAVYHPFSSPDGNETAGTVLNGAGP